MRWHILRTLLHKEALRHLANRGGIALAVLLVGMPLLPSAFHPRGTAGGAAAAPVGLSLGVHHCFVDYWVEDDWVRHLKANQGSLAPQLRFRDLPNTPGAVGPDGLIAYATGTGGIQLRPPTVPGGKFLVWVWY